MQITDILIYKITRGPSDTISKISKQFHERENTKSLPKSWRFKDTTTVRQN